MAPKAAARPVLVREGAFGYPRPITTTETPAALMTSAVTLGAGIATAFWNRAQPDGPDIAWAMGEMLIAFIVASATTGTAVQDVSLGIMSGAAVYLVMRGGRP